MLWPFPIVRAYRTSAALTKLAMSFADSEYFTVTGQKPYWVEVRCEHGAMKIWDANKFYAWGSKGMFAPVGGKPMHWEYEMPGRWAVQQLNDRIGGGRPTFKLPEGFPE